MAIMDPSGARRGPAARLRPDLQGQPAKGASVVTDELRASFLRLAERFDPAEARGLDASFVIEIEDLGATTMRVRDGHCLVSPGPADRPTATLQTSSRTWLDLVEGRRDGIAAFLAGGLAIHGDLNLAARFETLFTPGPAATRVMRTVETQVNGVRFESFVSGSGPPVVLIHGLGASKVSFLPALDGLCAEFEVHALDLPGFGKSSKPLPVGPRYSMVWFGDLVHGYLEANHLDAAYLVGNSMGGRIGIEVALRHPGSVRGIVGLGSAVALEEYRRVAPLLRLSRPQWLGLMPVPIPRGVVESLVRDLFHDPSVFPDASHVAAADDVVAALRDPAHRMALLACARQIGAERSRGRRAYWARLGRLETPSYWIFGEHDRLVSARYAAEVERVLPDATVERWDGVAHIPHFEAPRRTCEAITTWIAEVAADH